MRKLTIPLPKNIIGNSTASEPANDRHYCKVFLKKRRHVFYFRLNKQQVKYDVIEIL